VAGHDRGRRASEQNLVKQKETSAIKLALANRELRPVSSSGDHSNSGVTAGAEALRPCPSRLILPRVQPGDVIAWSPICGAWPEC
jgi:hypothetical protein